jgi:hypothetical protein
MLLQKIKMDLTDRGWKGVDSIHLTQNGEKWRVVVNMVDEPSRSIKRGEFLDWQTKN